MQGMASRGDSANAQARAGPVASDPGRAVPIAHSGLPADHNGRVKVDQYLRVLDRPEIYVVGDLASVTDPAPGTCCPAGAGSAGRR